METMKRMCRIAFPFLLFIGTIVFDRYTKNLAILHLPQSPFHVVSIVDFVYVENYGAVFGLFANKPLNFAAISFGSIVVIMVFLRVFFKVIPWIPVSLIMGGAIGNIIDRYLYGFVVDFIKVGNFYVFNIADACITIGAAILFVYVWIDSKKESKSSLKSSS
ncbi:MAG: signal peptidase II [Caldisericia bacterium]|nr:signal peptidase II [Caldisericia bacterium]